jgi:hypothetical protein
VLRAYCFRAAGVEIQTFAQRLDERTVKKLSRGAELVIDTFDNSASRRAVAEYCRTNNVACLHLGMYGDYGEARWNQMYHVPSDVVAREVCDYPLARNLITLVVAVGSEAVIRYVIEGRKENYAVTLRDLKINRESD